MNLPRSSWAALLVAAAAACLAYAPSSNALAREGGTHFLLEGEGGIGVGDTGAMAEALGLTFGAGGSPAQGLRIYGLMNYTHAWSSEERNNGISSADWSSSDSMLLLGGRFYVPVGGNVRIMMQLMGGYAWCDGVWDVNGMEHYEPASDAFALRYGLGFQVRLARSLSLGISVDRLSFWGKGADLQVASLTGFSDEADENDQTRFLGAIVFHF